MIAIIQRVIEASVQVEGELVSSIGKGILIFIAMERQDSEKDADYLARKILNLRIFEDSKGKMNFSVRDIHGEILVVSEFTLAGDVTKGNRPSFDNAMPPEDAEKLFRYFIEQLRVSGIPVREGVFRSFMVVSLSNEGPVTFLIRSSQNKGIS